MKKSMLAIACLSLITSAFAAVEKTHSSQRRYSGRVTDHTTSTRRDTVASKQKELTLKREWPQMSEELEKAGFADNEVEKIRKAYYNACKRGAHALEQNS